MGTEERITDVSNNKGGIELVLDIWHPQCWTLHITEDNDATLLGHGLYTTEQSIYGLFTASATSLHKADTAVNEIRSSALTKDVWEMDGIDPNAPTVASGTATRGFLVEWGAKTGENIVNSLVSHGFIPRRTYRMDSGREQWSVVTTMDRTMAREELADIRSEMDADIQIQRISPQSRHPSGLHQLDVLSPRQREVFELACQRGYYDWPRNVSATDLADKLGITKATVTEHLRKAESRLFAPFR